MRDSNRISPFLAAVQAAWLKLPDWRFGQLMANFISEVGDPFYMEDDEFLRRFSEYIDKISGR